MAKSRIKGITIELDGETKGLDKALKDVNKNSINLQSELKDVERLLKFDPGNTEALAQKQKLLAEQVENSSNKLQELKRVEKQVQQQFESGDIGEEQFRSFQREVQFTEAELKKFKQRIDQVDDSKSLDNVEKNLKDVKRESDKAKKSIKDLGGSLANAGKKAATIGAAGGAAIGGLVEGMEDYNTSMARLKTNASQAGVSMDDVNGAFEQMKLVSGETDSSVEAVSNLIAAGFDPSGITDATNAISGAAIKWSDTLNVEGLSDAVQETIAGGKSIGMFDELLSRSGINIDQFNQGLAEASAAGREQEYVLKTLTETGLANYFDAYREGNPELIAQKEAQQDLTDELAKLAIHLAPLVAFVTSFLATILEWANENIELIKSFDSLGEGIQAFLGNLAGSGMDMLTSIISGIVENLPLILETGMQILQQLITGIISALPQLLEMWQTILQMQSEALTEYLPMIIQMGIQLIQGLIQGLVTALPSIVQAIIMLLTTLVTVIIENLPLIINAGIKILNALINGILNMLPQLIQMALRLITTLLSVLIDNLPKIIDAGIKLLNAVVDGLTDALPQLIQMALQLIIELAGALLANLPKIIAAGVDLLLALIDGLVKTIPDLVAAIPDIINAIFDAFGNVDWGEIGTNIIEGLIDGVVSMAGSLVDSVKGVVDSAIEGAKNLLGIHSPSRVFKQFGIYTGEGFVQGMNAMSNQVMRAGQRMADMSLPRVPKFQFSNNNEVKSQDNTSNNGNSNQQIIIKPAPVYLNDQLMGEVIFNEIETKLMNQANLQMYIGGMKA